MGRWARLAPSLSVAPGAGQLGSAAHLRSRLQVRLPRLDREVPGARGGTFVALGLRQGRVRRPAAPHAAGAGRHGRCLDRWSDTRATLMPENVSVPVLSHPHEHPHRHVAYWNQHPLEPKTLQGIAASIGLAPLTWHHRIARHSRRGGRLQRSHRTSTTSLRGLPRLGPGSRPAAGIERGPAGRQREQVHENGSLCGGSGGRIFCPQIDLRLSAFREEGLARRAIQRSALRASDSRRTTDGGFPNQR